MGAGIFLVHAIEPCRYIPVIELGEVIFDIISITIELKIKTGNGIQDGMAELAAYAMLITQVDL